ncbi:MAG: dicarboxylate/amino acid:cation symporter [Proteobacteria bacterium]|nr:dicarboxylate/amino acid:cation symporter [Pseudomonadota bacterium]
MTTKTKWSMPLWQQVFIGLVLGVVAGSMFQEHAEDFKILGTIFINLIKMIVGPLIFFALVTGMTSMQDSRNFTRVGLKSLTAYLLTSACAVVMGLALGNILEPGIGLPESVKDIIHHSSVAGAAVPKPPTIGQFLISLIPTNAMRDMVEDHYLQIVIFSIFTGATINMMGDKSQKARELVHEVASICFKMIELIVKLAPLAVFGFMAWMVGTMGLDIIDSLAKLMLAVLFACFLQYLIFGVLILIFGRLSPLPFYKKIIDTQVMAFSTSSSKATLSTAMREVETKMGVSKKSTNFVLPLGACVNMDGTAIYLGICALFFAQVFGIHLQFHDYLVLILTCTIGSVGAAGIPSGSIIFMGMVLNSVGLPLEGIGIILGVDRLLDMVRTTVNITGDAAITLIVDSSEKTLNEKVYYSKTVKPAKKK